MRAEPESDDRRVVADDPAADDHDPARRNSGDTAQEEPTTAERLFEEVGACLRGELPGHLRHRREERQRPVLGLDRLVCDRSDPRIHESPGERLVGGDVQVREQREALPQMRVLRGHRLLDLQHELALPPDFLGRADPGSDSRVGLVGERTALPRARFDQHVMPEATELERARGRQRDAVFVGLDLGGHADPHGRGPYRGRARAGLPCPT